MKTMQRKIISLALTLMLLVSAFAVFTTSAGAAGNLVATGWFETITATISGVNDADVTGVSYSSPTMSGSLTGDDLKYLVREEDGIVRIDIPGLKAGTYSLTVTTTSGSVSVSDIKVLEYDRSGYAHFNYTDGVGAYNDDGTLKKNAIVLYVTNENKNSVTVTAKDGTTVKGIGNILGSTGMDVGTGLNSKGGKANTNQDILRKLADEGTPLVIRIIGSVKGASSSNMSNAVSEIDGLTQYDGVDYGGSTGDNGFMARMSGGKNITIEGIGSDATIDGWGLHFICQTADYAAGRGKSFEVRNITFKNVPEDCVGMEGQQEGSTLTAPVERCWIHHCSFIAPNISSPAESDKDGGDGACDFKRGNYFTNSYCYYESYHKTNLVGSSDTSLQYHLTYHHNYWYKCDSRGPLARQADIHMYNNIFEGQTSYCMSLRADTYIYSEYNMFINCKNVVDGKTGGVCKSYNNSFSGCSFGSGKLVEVGSKSEKVDSKNPYAGFENNSSISYVENNNYDLQTDLTKMKAKVLAYAGAQPDEIISPDNIDMSIISPEIKPTSPVGLPYEKTFNKTYVTSSGVTTKDNIRFNLTGTGDDGYKIKGEGLIFYVNTNFNITVTDGNASYAVALYNEAGIQLLSGSGTLENLPSGYYVIQSATYDAGKGVYKEAKIAGLKIEAAVVCTDHSFESVVTAPTCTKDGYTTDTCKNCGYSETKDIVKASGHTEETIPAVSASCIATGLTEGKKCSVCQTVLQAQETVQMTSHSYVDGVCSDVRELTLQTVSTMVRSLSRVHMQPDVRLSVIQATSTARSVRPYMRRVRLSPASDTPPVTLLPVPILRPVLAVP